MILEGEIKDPKSISFCSDFQTLFKHEFSYWFVAIRRVTDQCVAWYFYDYNNNNDNNDSNK